MALLGELALRSTSAQAASGSICAALPLRPNSSAMATIQKDLASIWLGDVEPNLAKHWITKPSEVRGDLFVERNKHDSKFRKMLENNFKMVEALSTARNAAVDGLMKEVEAKMQAPQLDE